MSSGREAFFRPSLLAVAVAAFLTLIIVSVVTLEVVQSRNSKPLTPTEERCAQVVVQAVNQALTHESVRSLDLLRSRYGSDSHPYRTAVNIYANLQQRSQSKARVLPKVTLANGLVRYGCSGAGTGEMR